MNNDFTKNSINNSNLTIKKSINNIFEFLTAEVSERSVVVKEQLTRWSVSVGIISIYSAVEYKKAETKDLKSGLQPIATFAFYPNVYEPSKIGSVAIYSANARVYLESLKKMPSLFGYQIKEIRAEIGMRLFVDVRFMPNIL